MILERADANPDQADTKYGRAALSWAVETRHEGVVRVLLKRKDVNLNQADTKYGWTLLAWAVGNGHHGLVKMLFTTESYPARHTG